MIQELLAVRIRMVWYGMGCTAQASAYYVGWNVGGQNFNRNANSRDAIAILDSELAIVGTP